MLWPYSAFQSPCWPLPQHDEDVQSVDQTAQTIRGLITKTHKAGSSASRQATTEKMELIYCNNALGLLRVWTWALQQG